MAAYISDKIGKPRSKHLCRVCNEILPVGEKCHIYKGVEQGEGFYTLYFHTECWNHSRDWYESDWDIITPGDVSRKEVQQYEAMKLTTRTTD